MRFFIKAYPMHELELKAIADEASSGAVEADVHEGMIEGIAEYDAIERLTQKGIVVQAIAQVPDASSSTTPELEPTRVVRSPADATPAAAHLPRSENPRRRAGAGNTGRDEYWLAHLLAGVTDRTMTALADAGAEVVERDPSGALVLRTTDGPHRLRALPFVGEVRPYGTSETLGGSVDAPAGVERSVRALTATPAGAGLGASPSAARARTPGRMGSGSATEFEAICHRREDRPGVVAAIEELGGAIIGGGGRVVRFIANPADLGDIAALAGVASVSASRSPRLLTERARTLIGLSASAPAAGPLPYDGLDELIGVADTGLDQLHPDFAAKTVTAVALGRSGDSSDPDGHGTHVAGIAVGDGTASLPPGAPAGARGPLRGVAPAANLYFQSILDRNGALGGLPDSLDALFTPAYDAGVRIHNNSWGAYVQARYDSMALDVDEFVFSHPDFLPVIAAGNDGSCLPGLQSKPGFVDYPSVGAPATAKNGLTVGASRSDRTQGGLASLLWHEAWPDDFNADPIGSETVSGDQHRLAAFSSRGPCDDMRIKPDVVAPGTDIASTRSRDAGLANFWGAYPRNRHYAFMGGTSMACPVVTGCAALVRQYYRERYSHLPSAALLKATLINGTKLLTGPDAIADPIGAPNYHQGFGIIDMRLTLPDPVNPTFQAFFVDTWNRDAGMRFTARAGRRRWELKVTSSGELRITLAWTDPPARGLQNQLRLILDTRRNGQAINWIANADASAPLKVPAHDPRAVLPGQANVLLRDPQNNVQVIRVHVDPGSYTLALFADSLLKLPQDFALVATFPVGGATITPY